MKRPNHAIIQPPPAANRRFEFHKRSQHFIRSHNETLSLAMRVSNRDCSRAREKEC